MARGVRGLGPSGHPNDYEGFLKDGGTIDCRRRLRIPEGTTFRNTSPRTRSVDRPRSPPGWALRKIPPWPEGAGAQDRGKAEQVVGEHEQEEGPRLLRAPALMTTGTDT